MKWDELEKAAKAATPGPWVANEWASTDSDGTIDVCGTSVISTKELCGIFTVALEGDDTNDVDFIAAANPAAILELLNHLSAIEQELEALKRAISEAEPVAYIHRHGIYYEVSERFLVEDEMDRGWTEESLYTLKGIK